LVFTTNNLVINNGSVLKLRGYIYIFKLRYSQHFIKINICICNVFIKLFVIYKYYSPTDYSTNANLKFNVNNL